MQFIFVLMYPAIVAHIRKFTPLTDEQAILLCNNLEYKTVAKKELLLKPGQVCHYNYFVVKGCLRLYFINKKEVEQITQFALEHWWMADNDSFANQKPSDYFIQAVENTEVLMLRKDAEQLLFQQVPALESYFRLILQRVIIAMQRRLVFNYSQTDEERYRFFTTNYPDFVQRIPQYMLASYLGFTPQFLSKLRAKRK